MVPVPWELEPAQLDLYTDYVRGFEEIWFVVPEGNGKTTLMAGIALHHLKNTPSAMVPIGASTREQAEILYRQAVGFIVRSPGLKDDFKYFDGFREIRNKRDDGRLKVYAADDKHGDGVIPTLALLDELHRHKNLNLYRVWRGKLEKRGGQIITISTAGEPASEFEDMRSLLRKQAKKTTQRGPYIRAASDVAVLHDWAVRDLKETSDLKKVAAANPLKKITPKALRKRFESPTMTTEHWQRFVCNIATRTEGQAITPQEWDALEEKPLVPKEGAWCVAWLDLGWKIDTSAMGILTWEGHNRRLITDVKVILPPVQEDAVVQGLIELQQRYPHMEGVVYDPNAGGQQMAQLLEKGEHPLQEMYEAEPVTFFEHSQTNAPMALAAARFDEAIRLKWLRHDGDKGLRSHALNAHRKSVGGEQWKYDRPPGARDSRRARYPIDALTGAIMGHSFAVSEHEDSSEPMVAWVGG